MFCLVPARPDPSRTLILSEVRAPRSPLTALLQEKEDRTALKTATDLTDKPLQSSGHHQKVRIVRAQLAPIQRLGRHQNDLVAGTALVLIALDGKRPERIASLGNSSPMAIN